MKKTNSWIPETCPCHHKWFHLDLWTMVRYNQAFLKNSCWHNLVSYLCYLWYNWSRSCPNAGLQLTDQTQYEVLHQVQSSKSDGSQNHDCKEIDHFHEIVRNGLKEEYDLKWLAAENCCMKFIKTSSKSFLKILK